MAATHLDRMHNAHRNRSIYDLEYLRHQCRWIRDDLDPQVARNGPDALHSDDILELDELLRRLLSSSISLGDIRFSRLHMALSTICGQATRWPSRLIDRADAVKDVWENKYGPLRQLSVPLYEPGGRLHGICRPEDLNKDEVIIAWLKQPGVNINPLKARKVGDLGFTPGDWWINTLFAFRDGIIDRTDPSGGIIADSAGAYAILMTEEDEISGPSPDTFTYRTRPQDRGRYRLTAATRDSRQPVRILRGHSLRSFWAPKAGVRYDGLHRVVGWSVKMDPKTRRVIYDIQLERLSSEVDMQIVLRRPLADEVEDYKEYKRLRQVARDARNEHASPRGEMVLSSGPTDGTMDLVSYNHARIDSLCG